MSVAKNTFYLTAASIAQKVIAFGYFTILANRLGTEQTGTYFLALSLILMFSVIADWGVTSVVIRETANAPAQATLYLARALGLKLPMMFLATSGVILFSVLLHYDALIVLLVALSTPILAADALSTLFYGVLRGLQNLRYEAVGIFIGQSLTAIAGGVVLWISPTLPILVLTLLLGSVWNVFYAAWHVAKRLGIRSLIPRFQVKQAVDLLKISMAFGLAGVFVKVYSSIDSILLAFFHGKAEVGVYAVAYKLTYAFQFLPLAFVGALYPAMSAAFGKDAAALRNLFDRAIWYTAMLAVPITFGLASTADVLIGTFYPHGYAGAIPALQTLVFVLLFLFLDFPVGSLLNASRRQKTKTAIMGVVMIVNVSLNLLLIPPFGVIGACWSAVVSFALLFFIDFWFVPALIAYGWLDLLRCIWPILFAGVLMSATVLLLKPFVHLILLVGAGGLVYLLALVLLKQIRPEQLRQLRRAMRKPSYESSNTSLDA